MTTLGTKQFKSVEEAQSHAYTTPINQLAAECGVKQDCYLYVNNAAQIEAAIVPVDAAPADEIEFIARYRHGA
jgi:hypothetical protein